jgi:hypothetical protein
MEKGDTFMKWRQSMKKYFIDEYTKCNCVIGILLENKSKMIDRMGEDLFYQVIDGAAAEADKVRNFMIKKGFLEGRKDAYIN